METKQNSVITKALLKVLPSIAILMVVCFSCSKLSSGEKDEGTNLKKAAESEIPYTIVEELPEFPGGDEGLLNFIAVNTTYPKSALEDNIQGRVLVKFCVGSNGKVSQLSILQGVSEDLNNEALRVVTKLPLFKPGRQGGKAVAVWYMVPITFTLQ